jgi:DedD protein
MGLFSRKEAASTRRVTARPRPSVSSEAQAAGMRVRARRRLAGAVALVLAAVIVLPMLLDGEPRPIPAGIDIVVPGKDSPMPAPLAIQTPSGPSSSPGFSAPSGSIPLSAGAAPASGDITAAAPVSPAEAPKAVAPKTEPSAAKPATAPTTAPAPTPQPPPAAAPRTRSDDGSVALALLEGRSVTNEGAPAVGANDSGRFVVQLASYGSSVDANERVGTLKSQGITNAYVEPVTVNGKQMFRLRVGPFSSRDAAQAAQTRLRTLGYSSGFIASQ